MLDSMQVNSENDTQYNFAYLIDVSDSMDGNPLQQAKDAYVGLTKSLIDKDIADVSQFAVIPFGTDASLNTPSNATEAISTIEGLSVNGFTNFNSALEKANEFFSTVPAGGTNIAYFLSDGFSTMGGDFKQSAKALQEVADVRAYGFGAANNQELRIIDSDQPEIVFEASELDAKFRESIDGLVAPNSQGSDSQTQGDKEIETASVPLNEAVEENSSDTSNDQILKKDGENLFGNLVPQTSQTLPNPEIENITLLGNNIDALTGIEFPVLNIEDISVKEGDIGTSIAQFAVNLSSPATEEIQFSYQTVDGSAISDSDYNQTSGQITIPVGETSASIDIGVNGDSEVELNEEFTLNLFGLSNATFENNQAEYSKVAVIENDDLAQSSSIVPQNPAQSLQILDDGNTLDGNLLSITDPVTGNTLKPSDSEAYPELVLKLQEPEIQLSLDNLNSITIQDTLSGGHLYAPSIIADGNVDSLDGDFSQAYFSFAQANSDGAENIRLLREDTSGFEDLSGGGDRDFNNMIIGTEIQAV